MVSANRRGTTERKIYFYRMRTHRENEGDPVFDPSAAIQLINQIGFNSGERYLQLDDGNDLCAWPSPVVRLPKMRLGIVRRSGLPLLEDSGNVSPLPIAGNQGLLEPTHMIFFPNGIVGAEFNFYGPRVSRLTTYLKEKCPNLPPVSFDMLLRQDIQEQLLHMQEVRVVQLRLHRAHFDLARQADESLFQAFRAAQEASQAVSVELIVRPERYARQPLGNRAVDWVRSLSSNPQIKEAAEVFKVQALDDRTGHYELFDLLKDYLVTSRQVQRVGGRERGVDPEAMYRAIEEAERDLHESLEQAAGLRL